MNCQLAIQWTDDTLKGEGSSTESSQLPSMLSIRSLSFSSISWMSSLTYWRCFDYNNQWILILPISRIPFMITRHQSYWVHANLLSGTSLSSLQLSSMRRNFSVKAVSLITHQSWALFALHYSTSIHHTTFLEAATMMGIYH